MNAMLNIVVRVNSAQALAQLRSLDAATQGVASRGAAAGGAYAGLAGALRADHLGKFGKNLQWTGRQLEFNFTLPLLLAGAASTKWALDNEKAMTKVRKVYGDASLSSKQIKEETDDLATSFRLLSDRFGVAQKDVIDIGAAWAAAGSSGVGLARATKLTMEAIILGEMEAAEATEALITIQSAYGLKTIDNAKNTMDLRDAMALLNKVENETAISFSGLVDVLQRAGGSLRDAGVDLAHTTAMAAAIVPTAGSAAQAGNSLRTMASRLLAPTKQAADILQEMGINIDDVAWVSMNGSERLEHLAETFDGLTQNQKAWASANIASRWQINKFSTLMRDMVNENGNYQKVLRITAQEEENLATYTKELNTYLSSSPQRFQILTRQIQNAMASAIMPLLPAMVALLTRIVALTTWFSNLDPTIQQAIMGFLLLLALVGPVTRMFGAFLTLFGITGAVIGIAMQGIAKAAGFLFGVLWTLIKIPFQVVGLAMKGVWAVIVGGAKLAYLALMVFLQFLTTLPALASQVWAVLRMVWGIGAQALAAVHTWLMKMWIATMTGFPKVAGIAFKGVIGALEWLVGAFLLGLASIGKGFVVFMTMSGGTVQKGIQAIGGWFVAFAASIGRFIVGIPHMIAGVIPALVSFIGTAMTAIGAFIRTIPALIGIVMQAIMLYTGKALVFVGNQITAFMAWVVTVPSKLPHLMSVAVHAVASMAAGMMSAISSAASFIASLPGLIASSWLSWPVVIVAAIVAAFIVLAVFFDEQMAAIVKNVLEWFGKLPEGVVATFNALIEVVKKMALKVYEWLSYINPFAKHSPSLVDQVNAGVDTILNKYAQLRQVGQIISAAARAHKEFLEATGSISNKISGQELAQKRADIQTYDPRALGAFDNMVRSIKQLQSALNLVGAEIMKQTPIVARWEAALDRANAKLEDAEAVLDGLKDHASDLSEELSTAKSILDDLATTPLLGMRAMEDQIFANEMAQKRLRLEMLRMEEAVGSLDDLRDRVSKLQGEIEKLRATQTELRMAGAGSDILSFYDDQIAALEAQQRAVSDSAKPMDDLKKQMDELQRQGEILDLEKSLQFDPLLRQIDQLVNGVKEVSFDDLWKQIVNQKKVVDQLEVAWKNADAAVVAQQAHVDQLAAARDQVANIYDKEKDKLEELERAYSDIEAQIREMESALNSYSSNVEKLKSPADKSPSAVDHFNAAGAGDFEIPGGDAVIGREDDISIDEWNKQMEEELEKAMQEMGGLDMFKPFKDMWNAAWKWIKDNVAPVVNPVWDAVWAWFSNLSFPIKFGEMKFTGEDGMLTGLGEWWDGIVERFSTMLNPFTEIWQTLWESIKRFGTAVADEFRKWDDLAEPAAEAFTHIWNVLKFLFKVIVGVVGGIVGFLWQALWPILNNIIRPLFDAITAVVVGALKLIRGVIEVVLGIINGDWSLAWQGIKDILAGAWDAIYGVVKGALGIVWGIIVGVIDGIVNAFMWLYDVLVGHSIVPDLVNAIVGWFQFLAGAAAAIWKAIFAAVMWAWNNIGKPVLNALIWFVQNVLIPGFKNFWTTVTLVFKAIVAIITWAWDTIIKPVFAAIVWWIGNVLIPWYEFLWGIVKQVFENIGTVVTWIWDTIVKPVFSAIVWWIENVLAPWYKFLWAVVKQIFENIGAVISWIWNTVVKPIWSGIVWWITNMLVPWYKFLWSIVKQVFENIGSVVKWIWENILRPVWNAIRDFIVNVLVPKFQAMWDKAKVVWEGIKNAVQWAWDKVKPIFQAIKDWITETLIPKFETLKDRISDIWDGIKDKISDVWDSIRSTMKTGVNAGITVINTLIRAIKGVVEALPGDLSINVSEIPPLRAAGGDIPTKRVNSGFVTQGARAIVGEGRPTHPEYVIPTDPRHRGRAFGLFNRLGSDLGVPGYFLGGITDRLPSADDVVSSIRGAGERIAGGAVRTLYEPFSDIADELINRLPADLVKKGAQGAKSKVDAYIDSIGRGTDALAEEQAAAFDGANTATGLHPEFLRRFHRWNAALGNKFGIGSGWRSYAQQAALYHAYISGVPGQAPAARPGSSNHERGLAIDLTPSRTTAAERALGAQFGLRWPMSYEPWHVEPAPSVQAFLAQYGTPSGGTPIGQAAALKNMARRMLDVRGWGQFWPQFDLLVHKESSWNPMAQNPRSTAFGLGQFLNSTWATVGGYKTADAGLQLEFMMRYISRKYGNPARALAFHLANNWYDKGGILGKNIDASLANGGAVVPRTHGGTLLHVGEGRHGEEVQVRPIRDGGSSGGETHLHFHGDLSFPNVKNGKDAKDFIDNLTSLGDD